MNRHYGIAKGSKKFPFREQIIDVNAITFDQAQADWDFLTKRRVKLVRAVTRWYQELDINDPSSITDIPDDVIAVKAMISDIDSTLANLIEQYPEVQR